MPRAHRVIGLLFLLSLLALTATGQPGYARLANLWALVWLGNALWAWASIRGLRVQRRPIQRRAHVGDVFIEHIVLKNHSRWPALWVAVEDRGTLPGSKANRVLHLIRPREQRSYLARSRLVKRGVYTLGPTQLITGDVFGLFERRREFPQAETLVVYPLVVPLPTFPDPSLGLPGGEALRQRSDAITPNAIGVREYAPGDPLKRIHWPSTARRGRLMVKEFALDPQSTVWLAVETRAAVQAARPYDLNVYSTAALWQTRTAPALLPDTLEYAAAIAASVGRYFLQRQRAVGLWSNDPHTPPLPAERTPQQERKLYERLAALRASEGPPLAGVLMTQARHLPYGSLVVVITPWPEDPLLLALEQLRMMGHFAVLVHLERITFGGEETASTLLPTLPLRGIPVVTVRCGDDLRRALTPSASAWGRAQAA